MDSADGKAVLAIELRSLIAVKAAWTIAQRTGNKARARAIHARIKHQRRDALHKFSSKLVKENAAIFVGDISSLKLVRTPMAKSVLDSGWSTLKQFLEYKSRWAGTVLKSLMNAIPPSLLELRPAKRPQGSEGCGYQGMGLHGLRYNP
jgi:putative transposase